MKKFDYEAAPLILALVLGPSWENSLKQSLLLQNGDLTIFFTRPLSAAFLIVAIALIITPLIPAARKKVAVIPKEETPC
jgi:putative tricarboxylic transport membrane protein